MAIYPPQLNPAPFQNIGSTLAGGAVMPAALAEAQGESLGANTQRAIAEANAQFAKNKAMANLPQTMGNLFPDAATAQGFAGAGQAGINLEQLQAARTGNQTQGEHTTVAAPDTDANHAARVAAAQSLHPEQLSLGDALNTADVGLKNAQAGALNSTAGLKDVQAAAGGYRPQSTSGVNPVLDNGHMQRLAYLESTGVIDAAHISRYSANPGAIDAAFSSQTGMPISQITAADAAAAKNHIEPPGGSSTPDNPSGAAGRPAAPPLTAEDVAPAGPAPAASGLPGNVPMPAPGGNAGGAAHATLAASEKDFNSTAPNSGGGQVRRANNLVGHSLVLKDMATALQNGDVQLWNRAKNVLGLNLGDPSPNNLQLAANFVGGEGDTFLAGQRGTEKGREILAGQFANIGQSPAQAAGVVDTLHTLMGTQLDSLRRQYNSAGPPGVTRRPFEQRFLSPATQDVLSQYDAAHGAAPTPAAPAPGPAVPPVAPVGAPAGAAGPLPPYNPQQPVPGVDFTDEATVAQAAAKNLIKPGQKIRVGGRPATWQ